MKIISDKVISKYDDSLEIKVSVKNISSNDILCLTNNYYNTSNQNIFYLSIEDDCAIGFSEFEILRSNEVKEYKFNLKLKKLENLKNYRLLINYLTFQYINDIDRVTVIEKADPKKVIREHNFVKIDSEIVCSLLNAIENGSLNIMLKF
ncbi:MAG: hypothetical protein J0M18_00540 [Ignavibacteria bacterium]|nr:hypothetical protein [Ignavibacteria bacterium]